MIDVNSLNIWWYSAIKPSSPRFCCCYGWEVFDYQLNLFTCYSAIQISTSCFSFGSLCVIRSFSISSRLSNLLAYNWSWYCLIIIFISARSVIMTPLRFLLLVMRVPLYYLLVNLAKAFSILFFFLKNQL